MAPGRMCGWFLPAPGGYKAPAMREALAAAVARVPSHLRRSLMRVRSGPR
ncbi:MAG TPA: hypothetical protein VGD56_15595 [Gemmatirosa sp.]